MHTDNHKSGFTLIELSIVLVIIGLIVGGLLVGRDLINASYVRAEITQIEKFQTAKNTFLGKYGYLPGDIPQQYVTQFGFTVVPTRSGAVGQGDGNGLVQGINLSDGTPETCCTGGETAWFWEDLTSNAMPPLMEGKFNYAGTTTYSSGYQISYLVPPAKIGTNTFVNVYTYSGINYFGVSTVAYIDGNGAVNNTAAIFNPGITVGQAYSIDKKVDDGLPQGGRITAQYQYWGLSTIPVWAAGAGINGPSGTAATTGTSSTCYDNGNVAGVVQQYSVEQNGGAGNNCALSFQFQ